MLFFSNTPENIFGDNSEESYDIRIKSIKYKSSMEFVKLLKFFILYLEEKGRGFADITLGNETIISLNDIKELFYNDYVGLHFKRKLEKLKKRILYLIDSNEKRLVEKLAKELGASCDNLDKKEIIKVSKNLVSEEIKDIIYEIEEKIKFDFIETYIELYENLEYFLDKLDISYYKDTIREIKRYTLENLKANKINYKDEIALLYIKGAVGDILKTSEVKYVIIDEAQDYSQDKIKASIIISDEDEYVNDIIIIQAYLAKGLEFDIVIIYNVRDSKYRDEEDRILLYTACTRALHILDIYYICNISPLLSNENFYDFVR